VVDWVDLGIEGLSECKEIGSGGFATVYAAWDERFGRTVAVKVLYNLDDGGRRRFEREQLTMGRMDGHPNVVTPHSSGYTGMGYPYLVMEYLAKGSLANLIADEGPLGWKEAVEYILPVADALGHGHSQGIVHRDVKPENILLGTSGVTKLADFGIASIREATSTQVRAFSLAHSPPETFSGGTDRRDERSDLYSLASTLFTIVTGKPPFHSNDPNDSQLAYIVRIAEHDIPMVDNRPERLAFFASALAKKPEHRPRTAAQFVERLEASLHPPDEPEDRRAPSLPPAYDGKDWWDQE